MTTLELIAVLLLLSAILGTINYRYLHMPRAIGVMAGALVLSIIIIFVDRSVSSVELRQWWDNLVVTTNMPLVFLNGLLALMLFAGSLHVDIDRLTERKWAVLSLATLGVALATVAFGIAIWFVFDQAVPLPWCFVLGALLAPTDPIAVMGILQTSGLPPGLLAVFAGESLLNDGLAIVIFTVALAVATGKDASGATVAVALLREAGGGVVLGLVTGYLAFRMLRLINDVALELTIMLALATGTYAVAILMHVSGPLSVVVAGVLIGHRSTRFAMSDVTREQVMVFWDLADELLHVMLFVVMGFALLSVRLDWSMAVAGGAGIVLALVSRLISVALSTAVVRVPPLPAWNPVAVLTWGGLHGGISIALALSMDQSPYRGALLAVCYAVVVWTILVQGLTMPMLVRRLFPAGDKASGRSRLRQAP